MSESATSKLERLAVTLALCMCLLPCVTAIVLECAHPELRRLLTGDEAVFEVQVMTLFDAPPLVGPYSRHGWHHPGPLAFWILGLPGFLTGHHAGTTNVITGIFNALWLALIAGLGWKLTRGVLQRGVLFAFTTLLAVEVSETFPPFGQSGLTTAWNPIFTLLPFAALLFANVHVALGSPRALWLALFLHAFITQSHLAYVPIATLTLLFAIVIAYRHVSTAVEAHTRWKREALRALAFATLLWLPTLLDTLFGTHNALAIFRFFFEGEGTFHVTWSEAFSVMASRAAAPMLGLFVSSRHGTHEADAWDVALVLGILLALIAGIVRHRARHPSHAWLASSVLLAWVIGFASIFRIDHPEHPYLTWWIGILGIVAAMTALIVHLPEEGVRPRILAFGISASLSALASAHALHTSFVTYPVLAQQAREREESLGPMLPWLEDTYACHPSAYLAVERPDLWQEVGGILVHLLRHGVHPHMTRTWAFMFGDGASTDSMREESRHLRLVLGDQFPRATTLLASSPTRYFSTTPPDDTQRSTPVAIHEGDGDVELLLPVVVHDGVLFRMPNASLDVDVEGSLDLTHFHHLGMLPQANASGERPFVMNDGKAWRALRLHEPLHQVSARTLITEGVLIDVGTAEARPALREGFSTDEADNVDTFVWALGNQASVHLPPLLNTHSATLLITLAPFVASGHPQRLTIQCEGHEASFELPPHIDTLALDVESTRLDEGVDATLHFSTSASPQSLGLSDDTRPLAAAIYRVELRPQTLDLGACEAP